MRKRKTAGPTNMQRVWTWLHEHPGPQRAILVRAALAMSSTQAVSAMRDLRTIGAAEFSWVKGHGRKEPPRAVWTALGDTMPIDGRGRAPGSKAGRKKGTPAYVNRCRLKRAGIKQHPPRKRNEKKVSWNWERTALENAWGCIQPFPATGTVDAGG